MHFLSASTPMPRLWPSTGCWQGCLTDMGWEQAGGRASSPLPARLSVGALTRNVTNAHVHEIFSIFGTVKSAEVSMDRTVSHRRSLQSLPPPPPLLVWAGSMSLRALGHSSASWPRVLRCQPAHAGCKIASRAAGLDIVRTQPISLRPACCCMAGSCRHHAWALAQLSSYTFSPRLSLVSLVLQHSGAL